jgi:hypothetical protein
MAAASESGVTVGVAAGSPVAGSAVADASSRRSDAGFAGGDAFWSSRSRDLAGTPATRVAGQPFAEPVSGPSTAAGVSGSGVAVDGSGLGGAGMPPAVARDPWAFGAGRCAACWAACWTASSASPKPGEVWESGPVTDSAGADRGGAAAADKGFNMIVPTDDAKRRIGAALPGSVREELSVDRWAPGKNLPQPGRVTPSRGRVARCHRDVGRNRGSYRTYSRPEYFAFEVARSACAINLQMDAGDRMPWIVSLHAACGEANA